jgi:hypothetical protein
MTTLLTTQQAAGSLASASQAEPSFDSLIGMGDALRRTGFLPTHIKDGVSFAAIVLMGRELGMGTMAACRKLQVIKGTVTERADSQLARFKSAGGKSQFKELSESKAILWLRHPNGDEHTETFTLDDAKRAGLASNDNYAKHPKAMLRSRAITAGLKSIGWEGAVGIYDPDEIAESPAPAAEPVQVRPKFHTPDVRTTPADVAPLTTGRIEDDPVAKARLEISNAKTVERLDTIRRRIAERVAEGIFTSAQGGELAQLTLVKAEILTAGEEVTA